MVFLSQKKLIHIAAPIGSILLNAWILYPFFQSDKKANPNLANLTILHTNVWSQNNDRTQFDELILEQNPDIVLIEELTPKWNTYLQKALKSYSYQLTKPQLGNFGIGIWSKVQLKTIDLHYFTKGATPSIIFSLIKDNREVTFIATHPYPPATPKQFEIRRNHFVQLKKYSTEISTPLIILGDLNASPDSPMFKLLTHNNRLKNAAYGFGYQPTWPTFFPPLSLTLDHCLVSHEIEVCELKTLQNIGSDHLPLLLKLKL